MATTKSKKKPKIDPEFGLFKSEFTAYTLQAVFQGITAELRQRGFKI